MRMPVELPIEFYLPWVLLELPFEYYLPGCCSNYLLSIAPLSVVGEEHQQRRNGEKGKNPLYSFFN